jgi:hypothetical protein
MTLIPPYAAIIWSWTPTDSPIIFCSTLIAPVASSNEFFVIPLYAYKAFKSPTVNEEDDPMPLRAGRSPS